MGVQSTFGLVSPPRGAGSSHRELPKRSRPCTKGLRYQTLPDSDLAVSAPRGAQISHFLHGLQRTPENWGGGQVQSPNEFGKKFDGGRLNPNKF